MRPTARCIIATIAVAICGCQTAAERPATHDDHPLVADWKGTNRFRPVIEVRVGEIHDDRAVSGAACWQETSGAIIGQRLDGTATESETGLSLRFDIGRSAFHIHDTGDRKATMWETRTRADGTLTRPLRTRLGRTRSPGCVERYLSAPRAPTPAALSADSPLTGQWTEQRSGTITEMNILKAGPRGNVSATFCTRSATGEIAIYDLQRRGPFKPRIDASTHTLTFEERLRRGTRHFTFRAAAPEQATLERAYKKGRSRTGITTLTMVRGAHPAGCLAYIDTPE